jgi:hypothetical protein
MLEVFCGRSERRGRSHGIEILSSQASAYPPQLLGWSSNLLDRRGRLLRVSHMLFRVKAVKEGIRRGAAESSKRQY